MNIIKPRETGAFLYHDGFAIKGISFVANPELSYDHLRISVDDAAKFISGEYDANKWFVWNGTEGYAVYHRISGALPVDIIDTSPVLLLENQQDSWLTVRVHRKANIVAFSINTGIKFRCESENLTFIITMKDDVSAVLCAIDVSTAELLNDEFVEVTVPVSLDKPLDIYSKRIFKNYSVEYPSDTTELTRKLPKGHFVDLIKFGKGQTTRGLQATVDRSEGTMTIALVGTAIATYSRSAPSLRLLFSMPDDPTMILHTLSIPRDKLRSELVVKLPPILEQSFDLWTPLLYCQASIMEI